MNADRVLAETFAAHEYLAPDPTDVLADIRRQAYGPPRRRHGRALTAIGAAIAVLAIAVGTTLLAGGDHHRTPVTPAPPEHQTTLDDRVGRFGTPTAGRFVDREHGFVLLMRCPYSTLNRFEVVDPRFQKPCVNVLLSSSDGGVTFDEHAVPAMTPDLATDTRLYVFDATHVAVAQTATTLTDNSGRSRDVPEARWVSSDGGTTWHRADVRPGAPVSTIPADGQFIGFDRLDGVAQVLTPDGIMHPLAETQAMQATVYEARWMVSAAGGAYFLYDGPVAEDPVANAGLKVSHDAGRTWQSIRMPSGVYYPRVIGYDGHWLYAIAQVGTDDIDGTVVASDDGGRTWQRMNQPKATDSLGTGFAVAPDGGVVYGSGTRLWHATGTGSFQRITNDSTIRNVLGLGPVIVADRVDRQGDITLVTSTNGTRWSVGQIR